MAEHLYTYVNPIRERDIASICKCLSEDGVVALPLDVAWSFVCDADRLRPIERIRRLKPGHPRDRPFSLICDSVSMAAKLATIDNDVYPWLKKAWPGAFTILLERHVSLPKHIHDKRRVVGIRVPACDLVQKLVSAYGRPLAASTVPVFEASVVEAGSGSLAKFGWQVAEHFGHAIEMVVDLGEESMAAETSIVDLTSGVPQLVREGVGDIELFGLG